ncbi:MAG TPA: isoprenylcysteine carboxylmethyltransferase family protein [Edaphobacter sp.]|nr:isoprenylcysteine carboxylmethyltransferase family protein [Edaphobacter sp.]
MDKRCRWGLLLQVVAIALMLKSPFWRVTEFSWRLAVAIVFFGLAVLLSWTGTRALGSQLRFDAAIGVEHDLIKNGPYRVLRHPIYGSMLCLVWGIGFVATPVWLFTVATIIFVAGTEIRVQIEDKLLMERFGESFRRYQRSTPAYVPLIR